MGIWENMMNKMMEKKLSSMSKEEKKKMMEEMMPKMMEGARAHVARRVNIVLLAY